MLSPPLEIQYAENLRSGKDEIPLDDQSLEVCNATLCCIPRPLFPQPHFVSQLRQKVHDLETELRDTKGKLRAMERGQQLPSMPQRSIPQQQQQPREEHFDASSPYATPRGGSARGPSTSELPPPQQKLEVGMSAELHNVIQSLREENRELRQQMSMISTVSGPIIVSCTE